MYRKEGGPVGGCKLDDLQGANRRQSHSVNVTRVLGEKARSIRPMLLKGMGWEKVDTGVSHIQERAWGKAPHKQPLP